MSIWNKIKDAKEFESFLGWLGNSACAAQRKEDYIRQAISMYGADELARRKEALGEELYLRDSKSRLIEEATGDFIKGMLDDANKMAREALNDDLSIELDGLCRESVSEMKSLLSRFLSICSTEIFHDNMVSANLSPAAASEMVSLLSSNWGQESVAEIVRIVRGATGAIEEEQVVEGFREWLAQPERRSEIYSKDSLSKQDLATRASLGRFAPLIEFIRNNVQPSERTEILARITAYVESGWAWKDLCSGESRASMAVASPWSEHTTVDEWRELSQSMGRADLSEKDGRAVMDCFAKRLAELSFRVDVRGERVHDVAPMEGEISSWDDLSVLAGPREVDVVMPSPGGKSILAFCATSDPKMMRQGDQATRFARALSYEIASGSSPWAGTFVPSSTVTSLRSIVMGPCLTLPSLDCPSRQVGESLFKALSARLSADDEKRIVDLVNALPMVESTANRAKYPGSEALRDSELVLVGYRSERWDEIRAYAAPSPLTVISKYSTYAAELSNLLADNGFRVLLVGDGKDQDGKTAQRVAGAILDVARKIEERVEEAKTDGPLPDAQRDALKKLSLGVGRLLDDCLSFCGETTAVSATTRRDLERCVKALKSHSRKPKSKSHGAR